MDYIKEIVEFVPANEQEFQDKKIMLEYIEVFPANILSRENNFAHFTSSGFIMNETLDKMLMIHHNIRDTWAWTGGHVDGDADFLHVAIKEAKEETGIKRVVPLSNSIVAIDILPVYGHYKREKYVSAHLHLSVAYILLANENEILRVNEEENTEVKWFPTHALTQGLFDSNDVTLYSKLIERAKAINAFRFNKVYYGGRKS